jgi:membrane protease YdiL (CAAX protease family)
VINFIHRELKGIGSFLRGNGRELVVTGAATLFIVLERYPSAGENWSGDLLYFAALPLTVIVLILRKNPLDFGLRPGNPGLWGFYVVVTCLLAVPILCFGASLPALRDYYRIENFNFARYFLTSVASLSASEFLFRGFLLFGLKDGLQETSILVQTIPFVLVHFGKPELETLSTLVTGIYFGYIAYRGKSFWPVFIIHLFINVFFVTVVNIVV